MPDSIPVWCFEASLFRQNGFSSLLFVPDMVSFESPDLQRNHKLQKSESGPKIGPRIGTKKPELKDPFCSDLRFFLGEAISASVLGPNLGRFKWNFVF